MAERPATEVEADRHNALVYAQEHLRTHIRWRDYLRRGGELPHEKVGDLAHHEEAIRELDTICRVLRHEADTLKAERERADRLDDEAEHLGVVKEEYRQDLQAERERREELEEALKPVAEALPDKLPNAGRTAPLAHYLYGAEMRAIRAALLPDQGEQEADRG